MKKIDMFIIGALMGVLGMWAIQNIIKLNLTAGLCWILFVALWELYG